MKFSKFLIYFLLAYLNAVISHKIFVYNPKFGASQVKFMGVIADILVRAGHDVTVYAPIMDTNTKINGTKLAKVVIREKDFESIEFGNELMQKYFWNTEPENVWDLKGAFVGLTMSFAALCQKQLDDHQLMDSFKSEKFDIALGENFDFCYYGVLKRLGIKNYISVSSSTAWGYDLIDFGLHPVPSYIPSHFSYAIPPFTYFQKVKNFLNDVVTYTQGHELWGGKCLEYLQERFGKDFDIADEIGKSAFYFINVDEHVDFPRPISHKVVYMGGIGKVQSKPLDKDFENIFNTSKKGVVFISFGSVSQSHAMPDHLKKIFLETFKKFPDVNFIWKYEKDEHKIAVGIPNVFTRKWVPQNDILDHPKLLAFVSHSGMNSVQEAASKGVPVIAIPLFADQYRNSKMLEYRNVAVILERKHLSVEKLTNAISSIMKDQYQKNAKRLGQMIATKPMSAEERVVKYTEFAAKYGPDLNLDMEGRHLNFVEYYCLDIIIPFFILVGLILYLACRLFVKFLTHLVTLIVKKPKIE